MDRADGSVRDTGILVFLEMTEGGICDVGLEILSHAADMAARAGIPLYAFLPDNRELAGYPVRTVYCASESLCDSEELQFLALKECVAACRPSILLIGSTFLGRRLGAQLAVEFGTGVTADCTALKLYDGECLLQTRPAFGGNVMADIITPDRRPQIATVRPGTYEKKMAGSGMRVPRIIIPMVSAGRREWVLERKRPEKEWGLQEYRTVLAVGRGLKKREDILLFQKLAGYLDAGLGCSRALVEKGWMSPRHQIGLSGNYIRPEVVITFGISGSVQFLAGLKSPKMMIAVNSDPKAPIFDMAHLPVCADLYETAEAFCGMFS